MTQMRTIESVPLCDRSWRRPWPRPGTDPMRVAEDFFGLADLFKENTASRACSDRPGAGRSRISRRLVSSAFASHVTAATLSVRERGRRRPLASSGATWRTRSQVLGHPRRAQCRRCRGRLSSRFARSCSRCATSWHHQPRGARAPVGQVHRATHTSAAMSRRGSSAAHVSVWTMRLVRRARRTLQPRSSAAQPASRTRSGQRLCRTASSSRSPRRPR